MSTENSTPDPVTFYKNGVLQSTDQFNYLYDDNDLHFYTPWISGDASSNYILNLGSLNNTVEISFVENFVRNTEFINGRNVQTYTKIFDFTLSTGNGNDHIHVGWGFLNINTGAGNDYISSGWHDDFINAGSGDDVLNGGWGNDILIGGSGNDTAEFSDLGLHSLGTFNGVRVDLNTGIANEAGVYTDVLIDIENITGSMWADIIIGNSQNNVLNGASGNDTLIGGLGDDTLIGGNGIDTADYSSNSAGVEIQLNNGRADEGRDGSWNDTLESIENLIGSDYGDKIYGDSGINEISGEDGSDYLYGGSGDDTIHGGEGLDYLYGDAGNDTIYGDAGNDQVWGRTGDDTVFGGEGNDTIRGHEGNDVLNGDAGMDKLFGNEGDDVLAGGLNHDDLYGGAGADIFVFGETDIWDEVHDFSLTEGDKLDISNIITNFDPLTSLLEDYFKVGDNGTHSFIRVDADGAGSDDSFVMIAKFVNTVVDETDFTVGDNLII